MNFPPQAEAQGAAPDSLADEIIDFITGMRLKDRGTEVVRLRIARALFHEYGISVEDMERDFPTGWVSEVP